MGSTVVSEHGRRELFGRRPSSRRRARNGQSYCQRRRRSYAAVSRGVGEVGSFGCHSFLCLRGSSMKLQVRCDVEFRQAWRFFNRQLRQDKFTMQDRAFAPRRGLASWQARYKYLYAFRAPTPNPPPLLHLLDILYHIQAQKRVLGQILTEQRKQQHPAKERHWLWCKEASFPML